MTATGYQERMPNLLLRLFSNPDKFYQQAKEIFITSCPYWAEIDKIRSAMCIFRAAYKSYRYSQREAIPQNFLHFMDGLPVSEKVLDSTFESFIVLLKQKYMPFNDFRRSAIHTDTYRAYVNQRIRDSALKKNESSEEMHFFFSYFWEIKEDIEDETFSVLSQYARESYCNADNIVIYLIGKKKYTEALAFLQNPNVEYHNIKNVLNSFTMNLEEGVISTDIQKKLFRSALMTNDVSPSLLYRYYSLLSPEEKTQEADFLAKVAYRSRQEKALALIEGASNKISILNSFSLDDYIALAPIIQERFPNNYLDKLKKLMEKETKRVTTDENTIKALIEAYQNNPEFLSSLQLNNLVRAYPYSKLYYLRALERNKVLPSGSNLCVYED